MEPYFQKLFADRIGGANYGKDTSIYKFEKIKRAKRKALADHPERELFDFGIGENDEMADVSVRRVMAEEINKVENRGYADNGILEFKQAAARYMKREFGVELDPVTQINHCMGTKTALAMLPECFINPGDVTLMTVPGYPVAATHIRRRADASLRFAALSLILLTMTTSASAMRSGISPGAVVTYSSTLPSAAFSTASF